MTRFRLFVITEWSDMLSDVIKAANPGVITLTFLLHVFGCFCGLDPPLAASASVSITRDRSGPIARGYGQSSISNKSLPEAGLVDGDYEHASTLFQEKDRVNHWRTQSSANSSREKIVSLHNYQYVINEPSACRGRSVYLLVFVTSRPDNFLQRDAIRQTWGTSGHVTQLHTRIFFILGQLPPSEAANTTAVDQSIRAESELHHDVIQNDFLDTYRNLTLKSVAILKWIQSFCQNAKFLLKTDDDMYINIPLLVQDLRNTVHTHISLWVIS